MVDATLHNVRKTFNDGNIVAVDGIDLTIQEGELLVLVGPSGCGKSTTMRCIAGLETPDDGTIEFGGSDVTTLPPKDRDVSMVFQNYALYPSMTVYENMAFGLRMRDYSDEETDEQVLWAGDIMGISDLLDRYPTQLSGGQQQRVALGRAIVREPTIFLLDEPLSNLDAKLRATMRTEIQELQRELNVATVFVTHDQEEAMTIGDRIAVMNDGEIEQIGTPEEIYHNPTSLFVADFIGEPAINFFRMEFTGDAVVGDVFRKDLDEELAAEMDESLSSSETIVGIRPEDIALTDAGDGDFDQEIEVVEPLGDRQIVYFDAGDQRIKAVVSATERYDEGEQVGLDVSWPTTHFFDPSGPKVARWGEVTGVLSGPADAADISGTGSEGVHIEE
ncbi:MAG: ABC transporter ATP-binding protein [Halanaeroarchaeum sp.]